MCKKYLKTTKQDIIFSLDINIKNNKLAGGLQTYTVWEFRQQLQHVIEEGRGGRIRLKFRFLSLNII